jgi:non-ribosomal peptide synthetase component F
LQLFAQQNQLTLNTLVQGAWALLLSRYSGEEDVLFGATVSGRPPSMRGVEEMVGLFINTLPVRVRVSPQAMVRVWLSKLQMQQVEMRQYEHTPLPDVQAWSEVPQGRPLFETLVIFENYPVDLSLRRQLSGLEIRDFHAVERFNYPLTLFVGAGRAMWLRILYDRRRLSQADITQLLGHLRETLEALAADPQAELAAILPLKEAQWKHAERATQAAAARADGDGQPRNPVEEALLRVWAETLGIERVNVNDNFFEIGGNSFAAIRLMGRICADFSVDLPLRTVFEAPTVAEFAEKNFLKTEGR